MAPPDKKRKRPHSCTAHVHPYWPSRGPITVCCKARTCEICGVTLCAAGALRMHVRGVHGRQVMAGRRGPGRRPSIDSGVGDHSERKRNPIFISSSPSPSPSPPAQLGALVASKSTSSSSSPCPPSATTISTHGGREEERKDMQIDLSGDKNNGEGSAGGNQERPKEEENARRNVGRERSLLERMHALEKRVEELERVLGTYQSEA